ncbi:MAG TPA: hypothetical protein DCE42_25115 [Myxococcales bacterium]|nr:hypothetical protein [Deltaproteobacteria bacterium]MBU53414.1 hypothetical protein [Deltaproteobacteria bacterium]HAA58067.1 hypothetical protein [Myxococcales bacterium]
MSQTQSVGIVDLPSTPAWGLFNPRPHNAHALFVLRLPAQAVALRLTGYIRCDVFVLTTSFIELNAMC